MIKVDGVWLVSQRLSSLAVIPIESCRLVLSRGLFVQISVSLSGCVRGTLPALNSVSGRETSVSHRSQWEPKTWNLAGVGGGEANSQLFFGLGNYYWILVLGMLNLNDKIVWIKGLDVVYPSLVLNLYTSGNLWKQNVLWLLLSSIVCNIQLELTQLSESNRGVSHTHFTEVACEEGVSEEEVGSFWVLQMGLHGRMKRSKTEKTWVRQSPGSLHSLHMPVAAETLPGLQEAQAGHCLWKEPWRADSASPAPWLWLGE